MPTTGAKELHSQAENAREIGAFSDSLKLTDESLVAYQEEHNLAGVINVLASRSITLRLLWQKTKDKSFLILAEHECKAACEIAKQNTDESLLVMPLYRLAQVQEDLGDFEIALKSYDAAVSAFVVAPPAPHDRPAVFLEMQIRADLCAYLIGDKSRLPKAFEELSKLEETNEWQYNKDVWVSGSYMKLAEVLRKDDTMQARQYLVKAKHIIDTNPQLVIRKAQWKALSALFH